jgi:hypothetical protein
MDSTPPIGGFMIFIYIIIVGLIGMGFVAYSIKSQYECKHTHFAQFRSRKIKQCIDCGLEVSIDATNW